MLRFGRVRATHLPGYWCVPSSGCDCCHGPTLIHVVLLERLMVCVLWLFVVTDQMPLRCNRSLSLVSASSSIVISFGLPHTPCTANADFTTKCNVNVHYYVRKWLVQYVTGYRRLAAIRAWQLLGGGGGARLSSVSCSCSPVELFKTTLKNVREPPAKQECQWRIVSGWFLIGRVQLYANILHLMFSSWLLRSFAVSVKTFCTAACLFDRWKYKNKPRVTVPFLRGPDEPDIYYSLLADREFERVGPI